MAGAATAWLLAYGAGLRGGPLLIIGFLAVVPAQLVLFVSLRLFSVELEARRGLRDEAHAIFSLRQDGCSRGLAHPRRGTKQHQRDM